MCAFLFGWALPARALPAEHSKAPPRDGRAVHTSQREARAKPLKLVRGPAVVTIRAAERTLRRRARVFLRFLHDRVRRSIEYGRL